jgi:hypothetical protein
MEPDQSFADLGQELARIGCAEIVLLEVTHDSEAVFLYAAEKTLLDAELARTILLELSPGVPDAVVWKTLQDAGP